MRRSSKSRTKINDNGNLFSPDSECNDEEGKKRIVLYDKTIYGYTYSMRAFDGTWHGFREIDLQISTAVKSWKINK